MQNARLFFLSWSDNQNVQVFSPVEIIAKITNKNPAIWSTANFFPVLVEGRKAEASKVFPGRAEAVKAGITVIVHGEKSTLSIRAKAGTFFYCRILKCRKGAEFKLPAAGAIFNVPGPLLYDDEKGCQEQD
jgi:hypothetical protein